MSETILSWAKRSLFSIKSYCAKQRGGASLRPVAKIQIEFLFADVLVNDGLQRAVGGQFGQRLVDLLQQVGVFLGDGNGIILNGIFGVEDVQAFVGRDQRLRRLIVENDAVNLPVLQASTASVVLPKDLTVPRPASSRSDVA